MRFSIFSSEGIDLGVYEGHSEAEALDELARAAGYESQADAERRGVEPFRGTVRDVSARPGACDRCGGSDLVVGSAVELAGLVHAAVVCAGCGQIMRVHVPGKVGQVLGWYGEGEGEVIR